MSPLRKLLNLGLAVLMTVLSVITLTGGAQPTSAALPPATTISEPPVAGDQILVFPQRDFVSASGYRGDELVQVSLIHPNGVSFSTDAISPQSDPRAAANAPFAGIVEVNHPGGACWVGTTPDIRPGDQVRITITRSPDPARIGLADQTTVRNVTASRPVQTAPGIVQVHGTAVAADGVTPLPVGELEQRLVANRDAFLLNGRRTLRATAAPNDGILAYDAPGSTHWTATYSGLQPADVTRALGAESRVLWLPPVVPATEGTIYENGAGAIAGPAPPCTAPLEKLPPPPGTETIPPSDPAGLGATVTNGNTVTLSWTASTDNVGVVDYGVYRDGLAIGNAQNADGTAPAPTTFVDRNVPPGTYVYTVDAGDAVGNRSGLSAGASAATVRPVATLPAGVVVHEPPVAPVQIISFPSRDFISSSGFLATDSVDVQVLRKQDGGLTIVSSAGGVVPQADPRAAPTDPFAGIVEVNHPGGACWDGTTPDIRVGDIIRTIARNSDGTIRTVDQTTTSNVVAQRPFIVRPATGTNSDGIVAVHGIAMDATGNPIDLAQFESRLIANRDLYDFNGRRVIRAGGAGKDGVLVYDTADNPTGVNWTATYSGLDGDDVARAVGGVSSATGRTFPGAESRALWLGVQPLAGLELTIYENDGGTAVVNGPSAPCTALGEPLDTAPPTFPTSAPLRATQVASTTNVQLSWDAASDDVAVYGYRIHRDGVALKNVGAATTAYLDTNVVGTHTYTIDATDAASPGVGGNQQGRPYGNRSAQSDPAAISAPDITAPSQPANLVAIVNGAAHTVRLGWSASTDNVAIAHYRVYRDGNLIGATADGTTLTFTDAGPDAAGLAAATYTYTVDAVDAALNASPQSAPATAIVTAQADTVAPSIPGGLTATVPDIHARKVSLTWTEATDNVGVTGYDVLRRQVGGQQTFTTVAQLNGTTLSYTDTNIRAGTYDYTVVAIDSAGNRSGQVNPAARAVVANDPPLGTHSIIPFPARDFVSSTGYAAAEGPVTISVLRLVGGTWTTVATSTPIAVVEDPATPGLGAVEVNHPGGGCWSVVTPNLIAGDVVRFVNKDGLADQTTVANVTAQRPEQTATKGTVLIHGTAQDAMGNPLPVAQVENRLVANKDLFEFNGRRVLRAGGAGTDGTLAYDAPGAIRWTATYSGLSDNDVARAVGGTALSTGLTFVGSESRAVWLGRNPLALTELTIEENGAGVVGGPAGPTCTAPAETPAPAVSITPIAGKAYADQAVGTASPAATFTLSNGGTAPLVVDRAYIAGMDTAEFAITGDLCTGKTVAVGATCAVDVTFRPTAAGLRQANLSFADNAANTTDQTMPLTGTGITATAPTAPGAPTTVTATAGNTQATVSWSAPASNGGSPITSYTVTASDPAVPPVTVTAPAGNPTVPTTATVTGLTNGTAYTFTVTAANTVGAGPASAPSNSVTPATLTVPGAPTIGTATGGNTQATVSWTAPASNGGSPITGYTVTALVNGTPPTPAITATVAGTAASVSVAGLTNGTTYTFTVTASNAQGTSAPSAPSNTVTPGALAAPGPPSAVTATAGNAQAAVTWTAPVANGGSPITGYTVTSSPTGGTATVAGTVTSATVTGLTNGTAYTFTVTATNAQGTSAPSAPSNSITPSPVILTIQTLSISTGPITGGLRVTITGTNFQPGAAVLFGATPASSVTVVNSTTITAITPAHAVGVVDVVVTNPGRVSFTLAGGFTYVGPAAPLPPGTRVIPAAPSGGVPNPAPLPAARPPGTGSAPATGTGGVPPVPPTR